MMGADDRGMEKEQKNVRGIRQFRKLGIGNRPYFHSIQVGINNILQMSRHSRSIGRGARARSTDSLGDIEYDTGETIFIQIDFLMVGNLSYCTVELLVWC